MIETCQKCMNTGCVLTDGGEFRLCPCHEAPELAEVRDGLAVGMRLALQENVVLKAQLASAQAELAERKWIPFDAADPIHRLATSQLVQFAHYNGSTDTG